MKNLTTEQRIRKKWLESELNVHDGYCVAKDWKDMFLFASDKISKNWSGVISKERKKQFIAAFDEPKQFPCLVIHRYEYDEYSDGPFTHFHNLYYEYDTDLIDAANENPDLS